MSKTSGIDTYLEMLQEIKRGQEKRARDVFKSIGKLEGYQESTKDEKERIIFELGKKLLEESLTRSNEDIAILEATFGMIAGISKEVSILRDVLTRSAIADIGLLKEVQSIKDWKDESEEILRFINDWVEERKKEQEEFDKWK